MYTISIPVMLSDEFDKNATLEQLKKVNAMRVFLVLRGRKANTFTLSDQELQEIKEMKDFFEDNEIETAVWFGETLGHCAEGPIASHIYTKPVDSTGRVLEKEFCPLDEDFARDFSNTIQNVASLGVRCILLDDDFCMLSRTSPDTLLNNKTTNLSCFCENHMREYKRILGDDITPEKIAQQALSGKPNKYRTAWLEVCNYTLKSLAEKVRKAVDAVDPTVRVGICISPSSWDVDGLDAVELTKTLAGNTKPLMRLIGAPYWTMRNYPLSKVIEYERLQLKWAEGENFETLTEGDSFPRPRHAVSATRMEIFDTAMRADGNADGIYKYMLDYYSSCAYENGYIRQCEKNMGLYADIERIFKGKKATGVAIFEKMRLFEDADLSNDKFNKFYIFPLSQWFACDNSLPITYEQGNMPTIVFGENARHWNDFDRGLILNLRAAHILTERGVDVGLKQIGSRIVPLSEYYPVYQENVGLFCDGMELFNISVAEKAEILTQYRDEMGNEYTGAYRYENEQGQRFLVYAFGDGEPYFARGLFRSYCRQKQLIESIAWLGGKLPAYSLGNPDLYIMCKESADSLAVGLWNICEDEIEQPVIHLNEEYESIEFVNCSGTLNGKTVVLNQMTPFSIALLELKRRN